MNTLFRIILFVNFIALTTTGRGQKIDSIYTDSIQNHQMIEGVVIKGHKIHIKTKGTNLKVEIQNSVLKDFGTVDDILRNIPMVSAQNGHYSVWGRGDAIIYIGQRKVTDEKELGRLNSSDIESVEIIRNPDSQYGAEAHAIIKINIRQHSDDGFGMRVSLFDGQSRRNSDYEFMQLTYNKKAINAFLNFYNNSTRISPDQENIENTYTNITEWMLTNNMPRWNANYYTQEINGGLSILPSVNHLFGISLIYTKETDRNKGNSTERMLRNGIIYENLSSEINSEQHYDRWLANAYYIGKFGDKWKLVMNADYINHNANNHQANKEDGSIIGNHLVLNHSGTNHKIYAVNASLDYTISQSLRFRMGTEISHSKEDKRNLSVDEVKKNSQLHAEETKYSIFIETYLSYKKVDWEIGLRKEWFRTNYKDNLSMKKIVDITHHHLYPFMSISFPVKNTKMGLSLTTRVRRPSYYELRNSEEYLNRYNVEAGNPLLRPQYSTIIAYSLSYSNFNFSIDYQWKKNYILSQHVIRHDEPLLVAASSVNTKDCSAISCNVAYKSKIGIWEPYFDFGMTNTFLHIYDNYGNRMNNLRPFVKLSLQNYFTLPHKWTPYLSFSYNNRGNLYEGKICSAAIMNLGVTKYMFNNSLFIRLSFNNVFGTKERIIIYGENYCFNRTRFSDNREISLLIRYSFRNNKKYKGNNAANEEINRL